jgi:DNA topoisomerase-1
MSMNTIDAASPAPRASRRRLSTSERLARRLGLRLATPEELTIVRRRHGRGFAYVTADGGAVRDRALVRRLDRLAVPPAYVDASYSADASTHLQAIWRDAAGRVQYRYHDDWDQVREDRRLRRLARLAATLPRIRRAVTRELAQREPTRAFALAAIVELVAISGIRAGRESYARANGTRGAATLLKSNVTVSGGRVTLAFRAKGGKAVRKELRAPRLAAAIKVLHTLPGRRLFQYRNGGGELRPVRARDVNDFLRETAGLAISLKDFRTLTASAAVIDMLVRTEPAPSARGRRKQVLAAVRSAADKLDNTPTICRRSYIPNPVVAAFENGSLQRMRARTNRPPPGERLLSEVLSSAKPVVRRPPDLKTQLARSVKRLARAS